MMHAGSKSSMRAPMRSEGGESSAPQWQGCHSPIAPPDRDLHVKSHAPSILSVFLAAITLYRVRDVEQNNA
jgi:hypothetical protein